MNKFLTAVFLIFMAAMMSACSAILPQPTEDTSYLTPIPEATRHAFKADGPVNTKMEAAIYALNHSNAVHFGFIKLPTVISVEKISLSEAHKRIDRPESSPFYYIGWGSEVWFVVLEGEIQVNPPPPPPGVTATPMSPFHGCNYVIFETNDPQGVVLGGYPCPTQTSK